VDGFCFYEAQQAGLGDYFLDSLFSDIDSLQLFAGIHRRHLGFYRLLSKRFPFAIYYRIEGKVVNVHAVMDCRQNPERIRERLE
jgi:hypothetical protein